MPRATNPCSYLPRRLQVVASLTIFVLVSILFLGSSSSDRIDPYIKAVPGGQRLHDASHHAVEEVQEAANKIPYVGVPVWITNPLGAKAHTPPADQANSTSGETKWFAHWKWQNPFSSSVTWDDERAVLPPLRERPPVYTYWDRKNKQKDEKSRKAEEELIAVWRRAWWAQGFKPVVLGPPDAVHNPLYRSVQGLKLDENLYEEFMRWLAWGSMGTGILSNWLAVPMAPYNDAMLSFLRRAEYPGLTRYEGLQTGIYAGNKDNIDRAIKSAVSNPAINEVKSIAAAVPADTFITDQKPTGVAYYSDSVLEKYYRVIYDKLANATTEGDGMAMLPLLITSHLHLTWQNTFTKGIAVLKPLPRHTTRLIEPAVNIALNLTQCPETPIASSCPPNNPKCAPCVAKNRMAISTPTVYRNRSDTFTIVTVPHPFTMASLNGSRSDLNVKYIRRETGRDTWIQAATKEWLGTGISAYDRLPTLKDAVAGELSEHLGLWLTAERPFDPSSEKDLDELDWAFGFKLPRKPNSDGKSQTPVPGPEHSGSQRLPERPKPEYGDGPPPSEEQLQKEEWLLMFARRAIDNGRKKDGVPDAQRTRNLIEAWSMADTEAWKFVRAFNARRRIERRQWEEEEKEYLEQGLFSRLKGWV